MTDRYPPKVIDVLKEYHPKTEITMITDLNKSRIIRIKNHLISPDEFGSVKDLDACNYIMDGDTLYILVADLNKIVIWEDLKEDDTTRTNTQAV